jgi:hypothetical protein
MLVRINIFGLMGEAHRELPSTPPRFHTPRTTAWGSVMQFHSYDFPPSHHPASLMKSNDKYSLTALRPGENRLPGNSEPSLELFFRDGGPPPRKFSPPLLSIDLVFYPNLEGESSPNNISLGGKDAL